MDQAVQLDLAIAALMRALTIDERRESSDIGPKPFNAIDLETLSYVERHPGIAAKEVATFLGVRATTMQSAVDRLHRRGLLHRDTFVLKGRAVALTLTAYGVAVRERLHAQNLKNCEDMLRCIDTEERKCFVENMTKIASGLSA